MNVGIVVRIIHVSHDDETSFDFIKDDIRREDTEKDKDTAKPDKSRVRPEIICSCKERYNERQTGQQNEKEEVNPLDDNLVESMEGEVSRQCMTSRRVLNQKKMIRRRSVSENGCHFHVPLVFLFGTYHDIHSSEYEPRRQSSNKGKD